jgi:hypothetical protein
MSIDTYMYSCILFFVNTGCMQKWVDLRQWIHFEYIFASLKNRKSLKTETTLAALPSDFPDGSTGRYRCVRRPQRLACLAWAALDADLSSLPTDANALATEARRVCSSLLRPSHHLFVIFHAMTGGVYCSDSEYREAFLYVLVITYPSSVFRDTCLDTCMHHVYTCIHPNVYRFLACIPYHTRMEYMYSWCIDILCFCVSVRPYCYHACSNLSCRCEGGQYWCVEHQPRSQSGGRLLEENGGVHAAYSEWRSRSYCDIRISILFSLRENTIAMRMLQ